MEANGERASLAAKFWTPLRVGQRESGPKLHRSPVGVLVGGPLKSTKMHGDRSADRRLLCVLCKMFQVRIRADVVR
ncbi:unnamed protein product [Staurois parvus]|uniref:Uncharacterized protein n=1 Tax=Staurois parvus TaxID=386267 RepID=A0ABN9F7X4_9NEOB|nr:unnamed protein product [Staurois parvus]